MNKMYEFILGLSDEAKSVLNIVQKKGPISKSEIIRKLGYKSSALTRIMAPMEYNNLLVKVGEGDSSGGRKPTLYDVNTRDFFVVNISIASLQCSVAIVDLKNTVVVTRAFPMSPTLTPDVFFENAMRTLKELMDISGVGRDQLLGAGIAGYGSVDRKKGTISKQSVSYLNEQWVGFPIVKMFSDELNIPAVLDVISTCTAVHYYCYELQEPVDKFLLISASMSIRSSFISNNYIVRPTNDHDDAFGHMTVNYDGMPCKCGNYGCIECYSSVPAIVGNFVSKVKLGRWTSIEKEVDTISFVDVAEAAENGDALSTEVINEAATILGVGISSYINLIGPDVVVISGYIAKYSPLYCKTARQVILQRVSHLSDHSHIKILIDDSGFDKSLSVGSSIFIENILGQF